MEREVARQGGVPALGRVRFPIRAKVLVVSLILLAIPFVGYGYVREMERTLRAAQEQTVIATARVVATALHDRPRLVDRRIEVDSTGRTHAITTASTSDIELIVKGLRRASSRIYIVDRERRLLAIEGSLKQEARPEPPAGIAGWLEKILRPLWALLLERPREDFDDALPENVLSSGREIDAALSGVPTTRWRKTPDERAVILAAAHPIWSGDEVIGAVVVEETTNAVQSLTNRAFERLLNGTLAAFVLGGLTLFLFASRLSRRLTQLRDEAEQAIDAQGRLRKPFRATNDADEIGDLSRSFSTVLDRLGEYNTYLERMADRLSHELRTPIAVVSSSLDNLRSGPTGADAGVYIARAEEGVRRLNAILTRIAEATRLERMLAQSDRETFDLCRVVSGCVAGYASAFPQYRFAAHVPPRPVELYGAPDLIAQMLDKLVDNARDFSAPGDPIDIGVDVRDTDAVLTVSNVGPPLPDEMRGRIFESMVSMRTGEGRGGQPHLGLGLFVVRLIAEFHYGKATARNRDDGRGVTFEITLPLPAYRGA